MKYRLKESHPVFKKVKELEVYMDKLGIEINHKPNGFTIWDNKSGKEYEYEDIEGPDQVTSFPHQFESKLTYWG